MPGPARLVIEILSDATPAAKGLADVDEAASRTGTAISNLGRDVDATERRLSTMGASADGLADKTDAAASKASTMTGALGALQSGLELVGLEQYAGGLQMAALATDAWSGITDIATLALKSQRVQTIAATVATKANMLASKAASLASKSWAAAQWLLNAALSANPIGLIVLAIAALVGGLILAYNKSETFRRIVDAAFRGVAAAAKFLWEWIKKIGGVLGDVFKAAIDNAGGAIEKFIGWIKQGIDWVKNLWDKITSFKLPDWVSWIADKMGLTASMSVRGYAPAGVWHPQRGRAGGDSPMLASWSLRESFVVNVYLDGKKVGGYVDKVVTRRLDNEGARAAAGAWA